MSPNIAGKLQVPHLTFGRVPSRSLAYCASLTDWGATLQITFRQGLIVGSHRFIVHPWPALGVKRFLRDALLHEMVHQFHYEVTGNAESGYRGHGPLFAKVCNDIGERLGLPPVVPRRRGRNGAGKAICNQWPHNVRPEDYYQGDIQFNRQPLMIAKPRHCPNLAVIFETILGYIEEGRITELKQMLQRELKRLRGTARKDVQWDEMWER